MSLKTKIDEKALKRILCVVYCEDNVVQIFNGKLITTALSSRLYFNNCLHKLLFHFIQNHNSETLQNKKIEVKLNPV